MQQPPPQYIVPGQFPFVVHVSPLEQLGGAVGAVVGADVGPAGLVQVLVTTLQVYGLQQPVPHALPTLLQPGTCVTVGIGEGVVPDGIHTQQ